MAGGRELDVEGIEAAFADGAKVLMLCSPHNPAGTMPEPRAAARRVAEAAARHGAWVLADEIHAPLTLPGATHIPFLDGLRGGAASAASASPRPRRASTSPASCARWSSPPRTTARAELERLPQLARHPRPLRRDRLRRRLRRAGSEAWLDEMIALLDGNRSLLGRAARRAAARGPLHAAGRRLPGLDRPAARSASATTPRRRCSSAAASRLSPGPQFGTRRRRLRPAQRRHLAGARAAKRWRGSRRGSGA